MSFRKHSKVRQAKCMPLTQKNKKTVSEMRDGVLVNNVIYEEEKLEDVGKTLVDREDYSLEALLAAGVPLQQLPIGSLMNPTDLATLDSIKENISTETYIKLMQSEEHITQTEVTDEIVDVEKPQE